MRQLYLLLSTGPEGQDTIAKHSANGAICVKFPQRTLSHHIQSRASRKIL